MKLTRRRPPQPPLFYELIYLFFFGSIDDIGKKGEIWMWIELNKIELNYSGRIAIGCPELHQIADVDQNGARNRHGRNPFGAGKHLQSANVVLEEQRERAVVGMLSATLDSGRCRWVGRIQRRIEQSAECGAVLVAAVAHHPVPFRKEILRQTFF